MTTKIKPLGDRVLVRRKEQESVSPGGIVIPETAKEKPVEGEVLAVGSGRTLADGSLRALDVRVGDVVLFGRYSGTEVTIDGEAYVLMREDDVLAAVSR